MGLLDGVLGGSSNSSGGSSTLVKALLMLLAAKAATSYFGHKDKPAAPSGDAPAPEPSGKIESGVLAGLPSLESILDKFKGSGHDDKVQSWIGTGQNQPIAPTELGQALGHDTIEEVANQSGMPRDQVLSELSRMIPQAVDKATPNGRL